MPGRLSSLSPVGGSPYGDRPIGQGDFAYGTGSTPYLRALGNAPKTSFNLMSDTAVGRNWMQQNQATADSNMAASGIKPMTSTPSAAALMKGGGHAASAMGMQPPRAPATTTPSALSGGQGAQGGFGGQGLNINTSIQPKPIYSPQMTGQAQNQLQADAAQRANLPWLMKQYDTPGVSRSEGTLGLVAPQAGNILAGGDEASANLGLSDAVTNQKQLLGGQIARGNEAYALGGLQLALQEAQDRFSQGQFGNLMSLRGILG